MVGKILGIYRRLLWPGVLVAAHFAVFALCRVISWTAAFYVMWIIFTCNTVWVATGVYLSLRLRKVTSAVIFNLMIGVALYLGGAVVIGITVALLSQLYGVREEYFEPVLWGLPYFVLGMGIDALILAFVVVVIGGLGSLQGALVGALIVSFVRTAGIQFFPEIELAVLYLIAAVVLL